MHGNIAVKGRCQIANVIDEYGVLITLMPIYVEVYGIASKGNPNKLVVSLNRRNASTKSVKWTSRLNRHLFSCLTAIIEELIKYL